MKVTEFAQKHSMTFFSLTLILSIVLIALAGTMFLHKGPRNFGEMKGTTQSGMQMQRAAGQMNGYRGQMQGATQTPSSGTPAATETMPATPTAN